MTFTLFLGDRRQMHCIIWEFFQIRSLFCFKVHDTQHEAEYFEQLWHHTFRRGAVNVDEY